MDFISKHILDYIDAHSSEETNLLKSLNRETHIKVMMPRMLSGQVQGRFLSFISKIAAPRRILEIGTFTGYSCICLAEGLRENGEIVTIDKNEEIEEFTRDYFKKAGLQNKVHYHIGNALTIIPELEGEFDIIFIDADKKNYSKYYDLCLPLLSKNGFLLADNVLWSGKILDENPDKNTKALIEFNKKVQEDNRVENILLSIRDGLMLVRKK